MLVVLAVELAPVLVMLVVKDCSSHGRGSAEKTTMSWIKAREQHPFAYFGYGKNHGVFEGKHILKHGLIRPDI